MIKERILRLRESVNTAADECRYLTLRRLGYKSSLVAAKVESDKLDSVAELINKHPGVSHNYERDHEFNLWFTLAVPPDSDLKTELDKFSNVQGIIKMRMLPTIQLFKIGVKLDMVEGEKHEVKPSEKKKEIDHVEFIPTEEDKEFVRHLQKDLEVTDRPFLKAAESLGITEDQIFERLAHYEKIGVMRRYAAILRHRDAGFVKRNDRMASVQAETSTVVEDLPNLLLQTSRDL